MKCAILNRYAIRESNSIVKIFKNFKEKKSFKPDFGAEGNQIIVSCLICGSGRLNAFYSLNVLASLFYRRLWGLLTWGEVCERPGIL